MVQLKHFRLPICRIPCSLVLLVVLTVFLFSKRASYLHRGKDFTQSFPQSIEESKGKVLSKSGSLFSKYLNQSLASNISILQTVEVTGGRLEARRERVREICKNRTQKCHFQSTVKYHDYFFYQYNTTVCSIAKAGSSTWRYHLRRVNKGPPFNIPIYEDDLRKAFLSRPLEDVVKDVNMSSKIITVRHPLTRLVSAYRNKYQNGRSMPRNRPKIERRKRKRQSGSYWDDRFYQFWLPALFANNMVPADTHIKIGLTEPIDPKVRYKTWVYEALYPILRPRINFIQFLRFVVKSFQDSNPDAHWRQYHTTCCPCHYDYEYITQVETLTEDLEYVFQKLGIPSDPDVSMNQYRRSVDYLYKDFEYYRWVPTSLRKEIYQIFKDDMDFFGYQLPRNFFKEEDFEKGLIQ